MDGGVYQMKLLNKSLHWREIKTIPALKERQQISLGSGLELRVESISKGGGKSFYGRTRYRGKQKSVCIGSTKKLNLKQAKERFESIKVWSKQTGRDPIKYGKTPLKVKENFHTLESVVDEFLKYKTDVKPITLRNYRNQLNQVFKLIDGDTSLKEMEWDSGGREKVMEVKALIEGREAFDQADRTQRVLCQVFDFAISKGWMHRAQNPAIKQKAEVKKHQPTHNPTITWKEVPKFLEVVSENKCKGGVITDLAVKTLLMTFLRVGALCRLEWDWYDEESDCWIIPGTTSGLKRK